MRADSICRASSQIGSSACKANSPKAMVLPRWAVPRIRPRCCLRCFDLDGDSNMTSAPGDLRCGQAARDSYSADSPSGLGGVGGVVGVVSGGFDGGFDGGVPA